MRFRVINLVAGVSLLACLAVGFQWLRSYKLADVFETGCARTDSGLVKIRLVRVYSVAGGVAVQVQRSVARPGVTAEEVNKVYNGVRWERSGNIHSSDYPYADPGAFSAKYFQGWGVQVGRYRRGPPAALHSVRVTVPYWLLATVTALLPLIRLLAAYRRRVQRRLTVGFPLSTTGKIAAEKAADD